MKKNIVRRTYDWMLHWADTKWGEAALFTLAFAESSFFPIPPDVLLMALCIGKPAKSMRYALYCTAGSVLGAVFGYGIGHLLWLNGAGDFTPFANFFFDHIPGFTHQTYDYVGTLYQKYNFWIVFTFGFTPIPYKIATITSGVFDINFFMFILASIVSRGMRFFVIAGLIWRFGPSIKVFIDKYFNWIAFIFTVLLIGGFVAVKYLF